LAKFLSSFRDAHSNSIVPSLILWASDPVSTAAPELEAICNFRDAAALSYVALGRAKRLTGSGFPDVLWADYFSLYPWMLAKNNQSIICNTPAVLGTHELSSFSGQSSPELMPTSIFTGDCDLTLFESLQRHWVAAWSGGKTGWSDIALFRSLNMAFRASAMPAGGEAATFYDIGRAVALWVSAFEILCHPGPGGGANLAEVYKFLNKIPFILDASKDAVHPTFKAGKKKKEDSNIACFIYGELYLARNDFLHGNPVPRDRLIIVKSKQPLYNYAAPLYRLALTAFLDLSWKQPSPGMSDLQKLGEWSTKKDNFEDYQESIERALLTSQ